MSASVSSTTLTSEPSASYTQAISSPMMPPPITRNDFGMPARSSAPVESTTRGSSGRPGMRAGSEPAAMMHCSKPITCRFPPSPTISARCDDAKRAVPRITLTLRCFASIVRPAVSLPTIRFFHCLSAAASISGAWNLMPWTDIDSASSITRAACSRAFDGMQPTLRHTPPSCGQRSTSVTERPRSAARNAAV